MNPIILKVIDFLFCLNRMLFSLLTQSLLLVILKYMDYLFLFLYQLGYILDGK